MLSFLRFALPVCFSLLLFTTCSKEAAEDPINHLPEIDTPMEVLAYADSLFTYTIAVEDIDGDEVTVTAGGLPGWLAFDSGSRKLSGTPSRQNEGAREITITADDGKGQRSRKLTIRVVALLTFQEKLDEELTYTAQQPDRDLVSESQMRTIIRHFRDVLFTELFPERADRVVPKTLIFAKDDNHAENIVRLVREEFGKGNDFCQKITYRASRNPEDICRISATATIRAWP